MSECSAAMLLMKLSCSPGAAGGPYATSLPIYPSLPSPVDSSGASSFRSATPSPPLSTSTGTSTADEGIVKDLFSHEQPKIGRASHKPVCPKHNASIIAQVRKLTFETFSKAFWSKWPGIH